MIEKNKEYKFFKTYNKLYLGFIYSFKFKNNKFKITKISDFFTINNTNNLIDFFTDLSIYKDDIIIGHGYDDNKTVISKINFNKINFYKSNSFNTLN